MNRPWSLLNLKLKVRCDVGRIGRGGLERRRGGEEEMGEEEKVDGRIGFLNHEIDVYSF